MRVALMCECSAIKKLLFGPRNLPSGRSGRIWYCQPLSVNICFACVLRSLSILRIKITQHCCCSVSYLDRELVEVEGKSIGAKRLGLSLDDCLLLCTAEPKCHSVSYKAVKQYNPQSVCWLKEKCVTADEPSRAQNSGFRTYYLPCGEIKDFGYSLILYSDNACTNRVEGSPVANKVYGNWGECVNNLMGVYTTYHCDGSTKLQAKYFNGDSDCTRPHFMDLEDIVDGQCEEYGLGLFMKTEFEFVKHQDKCAPGTFAPVTAAPVVKVTGAPVKAAVCTAQDQEITKLKADMEKLRKQLSAFTTMAPVTMAPVTMAPVGSFYTTENRKRGCPNYATVTTSFKKNVPLVEECAKLCKAETWCVEFYHNGNIPKCMLAATGCGDGSNYAYTRYLMNGRDHKRGSATGAPSKASMAPTKMFSLQREKAGCPEYNALSKKGHVVWSTVTTKEACAASCMGQSWCVEFYFKREANVANNCMLTAKDCGDKKSYKWNRYVMHGRAHNRIMVTQAPVTQAPVDTQAITGAPVTMAPTPTMYTEEGSFACANFEKVTIVWKDGDLSYCATECQKWGPCKTFFHKTQKLQGGVKKDLPVGVCMLSTGDCENKNHWLWKKYNMNGKN